MQKFDFTKHLLDANGQATQEPMVNILKQFIATETKGEPVKLYGWVKQLNEGAGVLELDKADKKTLVEMVQNSDRLFVLAKGQLLEILEP